MKIDAIWLEGDVGDWMNEVQVKLVHGHWTMMETGGTGILSDQGWKKRRSRVEVFGRRLEKEGRRLGGCWIRSLP